MKFILPFLFLSFLLPAQEWQLLTPAKNASRFIDIEGVGNNTFYALDDGRNAILKTSNKGQTWDRIGQLSSETGDMYMFDEQNGFFSLGLKLYSTSDGFGSLNEIQYVFFTVQQFHFVNEMIGYGVGTEGKIVKTIDGGLTWNPQVSNATFTLTDVFFMDENLGWACGENSTILKTTDGGETWIASQVGFAKWENIYFLDNQRGLIVGDSETIKYTTDGGTTWIDSNYPTYKHFYEIYEKENQLIVVGDDGFVLTSSDDGINWVENIYGNRDLFAIGFNGEQGIIGGRGILYETANGGSTWDINLEGIIRSDLNGIDFANELNGVVVGDGSTTNFSVIYTTEDGGNTWSRTGGSGGGYGVHLLEDGNGMVSAGNASAYLTTDYGLTWTLKPSAGPVAGLTCWMHDPEAYLIGGGNGIPQFTGIYNTINNGASWEYIATYIIQDFHFPTPEVGYAVGDGSTIYKTIDGGQTWTQLTPVAGNLKTVQFLTEDIGYIAGGQAGIHKTVDGGATWEVYGSTSTSIKVHFFNEMVGYTVSPSGYVQETRDGGQTWEHVVFEIGNQYLTDAHFFSDRVIAVGRNSDIYSAPIIPFVSAFTAEDISLCDQSDPGNEIEVFDLTTTETQILNGQTGLTITYYLTEVDAIANSNLIADPTMFESSGEIQTIFVRLENLSNNDFATTSFNIIVQALPSFQSPTPLSNCEADGDGMATFDLTIKKSEILEGQDPTQFEISFYLTNEDATADLNPINNPATFINTSNPQTIYLRITDNNSDCSNTNETTPLILEVEQDVEITTTPINITLNDPENNGTATFDLTANEALILGIQDPTLFEFSYYETVSDANEGTNPIPTPSAYQNIQNPQTIFLRLANMVTNCYTTTQFDIEAINTVSLKDLDKNEFQLFPNPTRGSISVISNVINPAVTVQLSDIHGRFLHPKILQITPNQVDISLLNLEPGIYFVHLSFENEVVSKKIIKF